MIRHAIPTVLILSLCACVEATMTPTAELDSGLPDPAVAACMSAVAGQTGIGIVAANKITQGVAGKTVLLGVGEQRAPWECRVDNSGAVVGLTSLTGEGAA